MRRDFHCAVIVFQTCDLVFIYSGITFFNISNIGQIKFQSTYVKSSVNYY